MLIREPLCLPSAPYPILCLSLIHIYKDDTAAQLVNAVLTNTQMWDQDLTKIEGLEAAVLADLEMIRTQGAEAAYKSCL